ncbi:MAG: hypothetical protein IT204_12925 [Fimbriimonadaceae bacterium]|nr:hypothetical protein [Fimbriimonadaceae bacterium]
MRLRCTACLISLLAAGAAAQTPLWDTRPDTWVATDGLGRRTPGYEQVGPPRPDRTVAMFYFLWLGAHVNGGPYDVSRILLQDPDAMQQADSPLWGPLHGTHHWGESIFGYYTMDDPAVLRSHAQQLADAGVDTVVFDCSNQLSYPQYYVPLMTTWSQIRAAGGRTPQVAFLCPFWQPGKVVREVYRDLYAPGRCSDLWFRWEGRPLILADPDLLQETQPGERGDRPDRLEPGHTLGVQFTTSAPVPQVTCSLPTWNSIGSAATLTLRRDGPAGPVVQTRRLLSIADNDWAGLRFDEPLPPGTWYLELADPLGTVGWWSGGQTPGVTAWADGRPVAGSRSLRVAADSPEDAAIRRFFCFRAPQPSYFQGPVKPNMWSWLEVHPQHVFRNDRGEAEQMSVGVAQNAVGERLGSLSEPGARGRTWHRGARDPRPGAVRWGLNFQEQWEHALTADPRVLFISNWNEWIMGRFNEFAGVRQPVMFVDEFNQEYSRDLEPMRGGHGDDYYYQLVSNIRRYKGVRPPDPPAAPRAMAAGDWRAWQGVRPEFRDDRGDPMQRDWDGYNRCTRYVNRSGRHDLVAAKVAHDATTVWCYLRCAAPLAGPDATTGLWLLLNTDGRATGWDGFDLLLNRAGPHGEVLIERSRGGWQWETVGTAQRQVQGAELVLALPRALLGPAGPLTVELKWVDSVQTPGDPLAFLTDGDAAPNGRFAWRWRGL